MVTPAMVALCALALVVYPAGSRGRVRLGRLSPPARGAHPEPPSQRSPDAASDLLRVAAAWDLLAACLAAGLPLADALRSVAHRLPSPAAAALRATGELIALGADPDEAWRPASACPATAALARAARRSARSGTALAAIAAGLAVESRAALDDAAEAGAQRAGVLVTLPLGLCFLPGFLCLGVIPVVIGLAGQLTVLR